MFLNHAVEPFYYKRNIDFYQDGQNHIMGSLLARCGGELLGSIEFEALLAAFQQAVKEKTHAALEKLIKAAQQTNWLEFPEAIGPLALYEAPECLSEIAASGLTTDAAFIVLGALISRMEAMTDAPYCVEHDQSTNLSTYHELMVRLIKHEDNIEFRTSKIANLKFPLKLAEVTQVESIKSPAVQLADVMIGAAIEACNIMSGFRSHGLDPSQLLPLYKDNQIIHLMPDIDLENQMKFRQDSQASQMIEYFSKNFL